MPRCRRAPVRASGYDIIKSGLFERRPSLAVVGTKRGRPDPHPRWAVLLDAARRYGCGRDQIETPGEGDPVRRQGVVRYGLSWYFAGFNRDKRSLTLNLRHHEGCAVLEKLIAGSDVLVENLRPGVLASIGFDSARLAALNPALVYCNITGFGTSGTYRDRPSFDFVAQAMSG